MIKNHQKTLNRIHVIIDLVLVVVAYALAYGLAGFRYFMNDRVLIWNFPFT